MSADLTGQRLGPYRVAQEIGRGGMSVVYRAVDERLQRQVALKVMTEKLSADPEYRARFVEEARAASAIDHVNVVPLYDFGEQGGWLYIAMRLVDGTDLAREIAAGPLRPNRVLALLGQVGAAIDMLHERGLVHLDVKPANVLITRAESAGTEHVYLADFGLTRRGVSGGRTATGDFLGSPTYASPEHLRGDGVGPAADIYSLTCVLFACLAGRAPFLGDVRGVIAAHLAGQVPSLAGLTDYPLAIDRVIAKGLAGSPASRYPTAQALLAAARRALSPGADRVFDYERDGRDDAGRGPAGLPAAGSGVAGMPAAGPAGLAGGSGPGPAGFAAGSGPGQVGFAGSGPGGQPRLGTPVGRATGPANLMPSGAEGPPPMAVGPPAGYGPPAVYGPPPGSVTPSVPPSAPTFEPAVHGVTGPGVTGSPVAGPGATGPPLTGSPVIPPPLAGTGPRHRADGTHRPIWPWLVLGACVVIAVVVVVVLLTSGRNDDPPGSSTVSTVQTTRPTTVPTTGPTTVQRTGPTTVPPTVPTSTTLPLPTLVNPSVITSVPGLSNPLPTTGG